jgi:hypothetical protein
VSPCTPACPGLQLFGGEDELLDMMTSSMFFLFGAPRPVPLRHRATMGAPVESFADFKARAVAAAMAAGERFIVFGGLPDRSEPGMNEIPLGGICFRDVLPRDSSDDRAEA